MPALFHTAAQRVSDQLQAKTSKLGIALLLSLFVLAIYVSTLAPGPLGGDPGEFQTAAAVWGLTHPTGYPLYGLLIKIWSRLPLGSIAYRVNLLAAALAAGAIALSYLTLYRLTQHKLASTAAALALAFSPAFWSQAVIADKYALNMLLIAGLLAAASFYAQRPDSGRLSLLAFAYGLSLTHHRTMVFFAPGLAASVLAVDHAIWRKRRNWRALLYLVLPLSLYAYLPLLRTWGQPLSTWWPSSLSDWLAYLSARGHLGETASASLPLAERLAVYGQTAAAQFTVWGLLLAGVGAGHLLRRRRPLALLTLISFALLGVASMAYYLDPRNQNHFLPSFLIIAFWIGIGAAVVLRWIGQRIAGRPQAKAWIQAISGIALCALPLFSLLHSYPDIYRLHHKEHALDIWRQDLVRAQDAARFAQAALNQAAPAAIVVCDWEQASLLRYFQKVEDHRTDVDVVYPISQLQEISDSDRPLYLSRTYPALADQWHPSAQGPLIALQAAPAFAMPAEALPLEISLGDGFQLAGFVHGESDLQPSTVVPVTLFWRAIQAPAFDYSVSLRLFNATGEEIFRTDSQNPVLGTYPTSFWTEGEIVADYYEIVLPPDLAPGRYRWGVLLYRTLPEGGWENLKVAGSDAEVAMGGEFEVAP
jgi:hypothetical protein